MEDWTDVMYVSMYGCRLYHYGNEEDLVKCENSDAYGMVCDFLLLFDCFATDLGLLYAQSAAGFWILFIMVSTRRAPHRDLITRDDVIEGHVWLQLSSLVMLNLVVGVVCSAMTEATDNHSKGAEKEDCLVEIVNKTGTPRKVRRQAICRDF